MSKISLKVKIVKYLEEKRDWVHSGELEKFVIACGNKAETGGREARRLAEIGTIEHRMTDTGVRCVMYRAKADVGIAGEELKKNELVYKNTQGAFMKVATPAPQPVKTGKLFETNNREYYE